MRADRLLSILMILQHRGKVTAGMLARELEVSERTIYRDISALSTAGVPIYSEGGPEGGYALVDHYRTNLTGLSEPEVRALFMLSIPAPLKELGISQELKAALYKLAAALPDSRRQDEAAVHQRIHLDAVWWDQGDSPTPYLKAVYQAVWADQPLAIAYPTFHQLTIEQVVEPYGLVAKAGVWYLVYRLAAGASGSAGDVRPQKPQGKAGDAPHPVGTPASLRVMRVSSLLTAAILPERFTRLPGFDLPTFWADWCLSVAERRAQYAVRVRCSPAILPYLGRTFGEQALRSVSTDSEGYTQGGLRSSWPIYDLAFETLESARERLLGLGAAVEVLEPFALRRSLQDIAAQIVRLYP